MKLSSNRATGLVQPASTMDSYREHSGAIEQLLLTIRTLLTIVGRHYTKILMSVSIALAVGLIYLFIRTPVYEATTSLLVRTDKSRIVPIDDASVGLRGQADSTGFETEIQFLTSREVGKRVVERLNLTEHPLFSDTSLAGAASGERSQSWLNPTQWVFILRKLVASLIPDKDPVSVGSERRLAANVIPNSEIEYALEVYFRGITVEPVRSSRIMKIMFRSTDPVIAALVANAAAEAYLQAELELRSAANRKATRGLNAQLEELRSRLVESESDLATFREQHNLPVAVADDQQPLQFQINELSRRLLTASIATAEAQQRFNQAKAMFEGRNAAGVVAVENTVIEVARQKLAAAEQQFSVVSSGYGAAHPTYLAAKSQLTAARNAFRQEIRAAVAGLEQSYQAAKREEDALRQARDTLINTGQQVGRFNNERAYFEQNVNINRQLYQTFLSRTREVGAANDVQAPSANILDRAIASSVPTGPSRSFIIMFFAFCGVLVGLIWAYMRHYLDHKINPVDEVERHLGQYVLAALPELPPELVRGRGKLIRSDPSLEYCEGVRVVAATIEYSQSEENLKSIAITAADSGSGKATLVTNLGIALSQSRSVLIIDADTSNGDIHRLMGIRQSKPGLLDAYPPDGAAIRHSAG